MSGPHEHPCDSYEREEQQQLVHEDHDELQPERHLGLEMHWELKLHLKPGMRFEMRLEFEICLEF
jgi:hypothetical protein